jgi:2-dehydro-3-deoxyphosphogluconate aldolase / (4S)-4-hydroxy-2-oxoglutarate aldolase
MIQNYDYIIQKFKDSGIIPVFNHKEITVAKNVLDSAYAGGVRVFEFTNREANALEVFAELVEYAKKYNDLILGIGTIMNAEQAEMFIETGADFIVSPVLKKSIAEVGNRHDIFWIPGCATMSEIALALDLGAKIIKTFPANVLGPSFISSALSVMPGTLLMPTGGVEFSEESLKTWFKAGVICVGMGSNFLSPDIIANNEWEKLQNNVSDMLKVAVKAKNLK